MSPATRFLLSVMALMLVAGCATAGRSRTTAATDPDPEREPEVIRVASLDQPVLVAGIKKSGAKKTKTPAPSRLPGDHRMITGDVTFAGGSYSHETDDSKLDDSTGAGFVRVLVEGSLRQGFGAGIRWEGMASDDDLFEDEKGVNPAEARQSDLFLYALYRGRGTVVGRFRVPVRVGPYFHRLILEDQKTDDELTWRSAGFRFSASPEYRIVDGRAFALTLFGEISFGAHSTTIESDARDDEYDSSGSTVGMDLGVRVVMAKHIMAELSLIYRGGFWEESDKEKGFRVGETTNGFGGVSLAFGAGF